MWEVPYEMGGDMLVAKQECNKRRLVLTPKYQWKTNRSVQRAMVIFNGHKHVVIERFLLSLFHINLTTRNIVPNG